MLLIKRVKVAELMITIVEPLVYKLAVAVPVNVAVLPLTVGTTLCKSTLIPKFVGADNWLIVRVWLTLSSAKAWIWIEVLWLANVNVPLTVKLCPLNGKLPALPASTARRAAPVVSLSRFAHCVKCSPVVMSVGIWVLI